MNHTRIRVPAAGILGAFSRLYLPVYTVPVGYVFDGRRIAFDMADIAFDGSDLLAQSAPLADPSSTLEYLRSGLRIEWGNPQNPCYPGQGAVPGLQNWGEDEGPHLTGGETFEVKMRLSTGGFRIIVLLEGILSRAKS